MKKILLLYPFLFITWFLSASEESKYTIYITPLIEQQQSHFYVHSSFGESNLDRLQQEYQREWYFQQLQEQCKNNNIDLIWASPQAQNVHTRCTVINFLNGPIWAYQHLRPSPLPQHFYDSFKSVNLISHCLWGNRSAAKYHAYFLEKLIKHDISEGSPESHAYARAEMRAWGYYEYEGFRSFLKQLPVYEEYMLEIAAQLQHDAIFASLVREASVVAADYIPQEAQRIRDAHHKRVEEEQRRQKAYVQDQQHHIAQLVFVQQKEQLEHKAHAWEATHPERATAYHKTLAENGIHSQQSYHLSPVAQTVLQKAGIAWTSYAQLSGNALQHELMHEIIAGIEHGAQINQLPEKSFSQMLQKQSVLLFDTARQANEIGDCDGTSQLIDFGNQLLDCCTACLKGTADGVKSGAIDAVVGTIEMVQHPIEALQTLAQTVITLGCLAQDYIPLLPDHDLSLEEYDAYLKKCDAAEQKWHIAIMQINQKWRDTPTPELVYQVIHGATTLATNIFVTHGCTQLVSSVARSIRPAVAQAITKLGKKISHLELQATSPGFILLQKQSQVSTIFEYGNHFGLTHEEVTAALKTIHASDFGSIDRFERVLVEFGRHPGVERTIRETFHHCISGDLKRAKGTYNELRSALYWKERGYIIDAFNVTVENYTADFVMNDYLVECKYVDWNNLITKVDALERLRDQMKRASRAAYLNNKKVLLHSKWPIPEHLEWLQQEILSKGNIEIMIG